MKAFVLILLVLSFFSSAGAAVLGQAEKEKGVESREIELLKADLARLREKLDEERDASKKELEALREEMGSLRKEVAQGAEPSASSPPAAPPPVQYNTFNPAISVIGNFLGRQDDRPVLAGEEGERADDQVNLREVELDMRLPVDPFADAVLILSVESERAGRFEAGVEEGYFVLKKLPFLEVPPLGLKLKAGRFRPELGRLNRFHTHDLPQMNRPLAIEEFLGKEGFVQSGLSAQFFLPTPWDKESALELVLQGLNGGEVATAPGGENDFAYLGHLRWFRTFADVHDLEVGASTYRGYTDPQGRRAAWLHGLDFFYRWKPLRYGEWRSFLLGGELFYSDRKLPKIFEIAFHGRKREKPLGAYLMGQVQWDKRWYAGVRWDWTQTIADDTAERMQLAPYVSYYLSELLRARVGYEHTWSDLRGEDGRDTFLFELTWIFGAHPPEPYWVHK